MNALKDNAMEIVMFVNLKLNVLIVKYVNIKTHVIIDKVTKYDYKGYQ